MNPLKSGYDLKIRGNPNGIRVKINPDPTNL